MLKFTAAFLETNPQALVFYGQPNRVMELRLETLPEAAKLPRFNYYSVMTVTEPVMPLPTDFPKFWEGQTEPGLDDDAYEAALQTYESNMATHQNDIEKGKILTGLFVRESQISPIIFHTASRTTTAAYQEPEPAAIAVTNKALEEAVKQGTATLQMVDNHEETCKRRETRNQELDREKVFARIHEQFKQLMKNGKDAKPSDRADIAAGRFLIYSLLDGEQRTVVMKRLFPKKRVGELKFNIIFEKFATMDEQQAGWMVRQAMLRNDSGANPKNVASEFLFQVAAGAGIDVTGIEKSQATVAKKRQKNLKTKLSGLHSLRNRLAA
jgi:hypothetical protein